MTDRKVTVNETDLRAILADITAYQWLAAAKCVEGFLNALGPEPCGHPSNATLVPYVPTFRCVLPRGHHDHLGTACWANCTVLADDPIHCGDAHVPPGDVWAES